MDGFSNERERTNELNAVLFYNSSFDFIDFIRGMFWMFNSMCVLQKHEWLLERYWLWHCVQALHA